MQTASSTCYCRHHWKWTVSSCSWVAADPSEWHCHYPNPVNRSMQVMLLLATMVALFPSFMSISGWGFFQTLTHGLSGDNDNCVLLHNKCNWNDVWSLMSHTIVIVLIIVVMDDNWCMPTMVALAVAIILGNNRRSIYNTYGLSSLLVLTIFCGIRTCHQLLAYTLQIINRLSPLNTHACVIAPWQSEWKPQQMVWYPNTTVWHAQEEVFPQNSMKRWAEGTNIPERYWAPTDMLKGLISPKGK